MVGVVTYSTNGTLTGGFSTVGLAPSPFGVLAHQGGILVSSSSANDDIHRFTLTGTSLGTFHNSASLAFVEQMAFSTDGLVMAAAFSSNNVGFLDPNTGALVRSFTASGARGVYQLGNGNVLWTNSAGTFVYDPTNGTSTQVYAGGGRYLEFAPIPEPSPLLTTAAGGLLLVAFRRYVRRRK
jgi:outer membrane protein assembly factor BamB